MIALLVSWLRAEHWPSFSLTSTSKIGCYSEHRDLRQKSSLLKPTKASRLLEHGWINDWPYIFELCVAALHDACNYSKGQMSLKKQGPLPGLRESGWRGCGGGEVAKHTVYIRGSRIANDFSQGEREIHSKQP